MIDLILGIKYANNDEDYKRCLDYLELHGVKVLKGTELFYVTKQELGNEVIVAVAGWHVDLGGAIEPLVSEDAGYTKTLGIFMYGYLTGKGFRHISCWTSNEEWKNILIKIGFTICNENTSRLVKEV